MGKYNYWIKEQLDKGLDLSKLDNDVAAGIRGMKQGTDNFTKDVDKMIQLDGLLKTARKDMIEKAIVSKGKSTEEKPKTTKSKSKSKPKPEKPSKKGIEAFTLRPSEKKYFANVKWGAKDGKQALVLTNSVSHHETVTLNDQKAAEAMLRHLYNTFIEDIDARSKSTNIDLLKEIHKLKIYSPSGTKISTPDLKSEMYDTAMAEIKKHFGSAPKKKGHKSDYRDKVETELAKMLGISEKAASKIIAVEHEDYVSANADADIKPKVTAGFIKEHLPWGFVDIIKSDTDKQTVASIESCKKILKEADFKVTKRKKGKKVQTVKTIRPDRAIIKDRNESVYRTITKDLSEKKPLEKETLSAIDELKSVTSKIFAKIDRLAADKKAEKIKAVVEALKKLL